MAKVQGKNAAEKENDDGLREKMIAVNRVSKVVKGGRTMSFAALTVVGDGDGRIGMGKGKAREVPVSVQKAMEQARRGMFKVALKNGTLHHSVVGKHGAGGIGQAGADVAVVLVPDHIMRLGLRVGPLEDHGGAAVADQDARVDQHAGRHTFVEPMALELARTARDAHQPARQRRIDARFVRHDLRFPLGVRIIEVQRHEPLARGRLQILRAALIAGVVGHDQLEVGMRPHHLALLVQGQNAPRVGQRVDHHGRILARLDDLIQVADAAVAHRQRQRAVVPGGAGGVQQIAADEVGRRHVFVARQRDQRKPQLPRHVLHEPRLATAGGAFQDHWQPVRVGMRVQRGFPAGRAVEGFMRNPIGVEGRRHGSYPFRRRPAGLEPGRTGWAGHAPSGAWTLRWEFPPSGIPACRPWTG